MNVRRESRPNSMRGGDRSSHDAEPARTRRGAAVTTAARSSLSDLFKRKLDDDMIVSGDTWLSESGIQQQLEFEGYQLRWVAENRLDVNVAEGWQYVTVSRFLWWYRRVRRRHEGRVQYLLKRVRSFRSLGA